MSLRKKLIFTLLLVTFILVSAVLVFEIPRVKNYVYEDAKHEARHARQILMATRRVYHKQFLESGLELSDKTLGFLPAHAIRRVSDDVSSWGDDLFSFRNVSDAPRNPENMSREYELGAFDFFRKNPEAKEYFIEVSDFGSEHFFLYATPIYTEEYCLKCHGDRAVAPETIRKRYMAGYGHAVGDLQGILSIAIPHDKLYAHFMGHLRGNIYAKLATVAVLLLSLYFLLQKIVLGRIALLKSAAGQWAAGDYSLKLQLDSSDEIAELSGACNRMISEIQERESDLERGKEKIRHLSQELEAILEGIESSIFLVSEDGDFIWMNSKARARLAASAATEGVRCCDVLPIFGLSVYRCPVHDVFRSGKLFQEEFLCKDGSILEVAVFPLFDVPGKVDRAILKLRDISERARLREEVERAGRLATLGELSASIGHEINNPLSKLLMSLPMMKEIQDEELKIMDALEGERGGIQICGVDYSRMREQIPKLYESTIDATRRINSISEDLKRFVRQENKEHAVLDLNELVLSSARLCAHYIVKTTDRFETVLDDDLPALKGNRGMIEQVVTNLIINACQALESRSSGVTVSTGQEEARGTVFLKVADEGDGIEPALLPRIMEPLFTTKAGSGGTGLGLSLSQRIVKEHGGEISFESTPGAGTTVTVSFPALSAEGSVEAGLTV